MRNCNGHSRVKLTYSPDTQREPLFLALLEGHKVPLGRVVMAGKNMPWAREGRELINMDFYTLTIWTLPGNLIKKKKKRTTSEYIPFQEFSVYCSTKQLQFRTCENISKSFRSQETFPHE